MIELKYKRTLGLVLVSVLMASCGGGGGDFSILTGVKPPPPPPQPVGKEVGQVSCAGTSCQLPETAARSDSGSVYQFSNAGPAPMQLSISGPLSNNWFAVVNQVSVDGSQVQGRIGGARGHDERIEHEEGLVFDAIAKSARSGALAWRQSRLTMPQLQADVPETTYDLGATRTWHDMQGDSQSTLQAKRPLPNGGYVYVWAQTGLNISATAQQADALAERFVNSVYPLEASLASEPWGNKVDASWNGLAIPASTKSVHLVLSRLNDQSKPRTSTLLGYVRPSNALLASQSAALCESDAKCADIVKNSNEALATFVDIDTFTLVDKGASGWVATGNGPSMALSTLAHEYQHVLYAYNKLYGRPAGSPSTTVWENEMAAQTMAYLVASDTFTGGRGSGPDSHPDLRPHHDFEQFLARPNCNMKAWGALKDVSQDYSCYPKALVAGMLALHQFGEGVLKPWITGREVGEASLNAGLASQSPGENYSSLMRRLSTTLALSVSNGFPAGYGFPTRVINIQPNRYFPNGKTVTLQNVPFSKDDVHMDTDPSKETYKLALQVAGGKATVTLPANSHLLLVKP